MELELYGAFSMVLAGVIAYKSTSSYRVLVFVISLWILAADVLSTQSLVITMPKDFGFDLQPNRLLLLFCLGNLMVMLPVWHRQQGTESTVHYEVYLSIYFILSLLVLCVHTSLGLVTSKEAFTTYSGWIAFGALYLVVKKQADQGFIKSVFVSLICVAVITSIVSVVQFFIYSEFLRAGVERVAFSGNFRSTGVFYAEYTQGYFLIPAMIVVLTTEASPSRRLLLLVVCLVGVILTFHRMSWAIAILLVGSSFFLRLSSGGKLILVGGLIGLLSVVLFDVLPMLKSDVGSDFVSQRLIENTLTGRFSLYEVALRRVQDVWLIGVGSTQSNTYFFDVSSSGQRYAAMGETGGIHNLPINMAYLYGLPVAVTFAFFVFAAAKFFVRKLMQGKPFYLIPTAVLSMYILANLSNWFYPNTDVALLVAIILGVSAASLRNSPPVACTSGVQVK